MAKRKRSTQSKKKKTKKQSAQEVETQGEYWVEKVLDWGYHDNGTLMYLVKWENYPEEENSWEFDYHVPCDDLIHYFNENTVNGRYPPKFSFEEYDMFCDYLQELISKDSNPKTQDLAVMARLVKGKVNTLDLNNAKLIKEMLETLKATLNRLEEARSKTKNGQSNSKRLELVPLLKEIKKSLHIEKCFGSITGFFDFIDSRSDVLKSLRKVEKSFNEIIAKEGEGSPISICNYLDSEVPQLEAYITDYIFDTKIHKKPKIIEPEHPLISCKCDDCYESRDECCIAVNGFPMVYQKNGRLSRKQSEGNLIFECNSKCKCDPSCPNRQVQRGRQFRLEIFRTENKGWGVRTLDKIPKGIYITNYTGEVISLMEAGERPTTYLYDLGSHLDSTDVEFTYVVDASKYGNVARFINHSCAPNCRTFFTWIERSPNNMLPIISLFAIKDIRPLEELTYDYSMEVIDYYDTADDLNSGVFSVEEQNEERQSEIGEESNEIEEMKEISCKTDENKDNVLDTSSDSSDVHSNDIPIQSSSSILRTQNIDFKKIKCECGANNCRLFLYS